MSDRVTTCDHGEVGGLGAEWKAHDADARLLHTPVIARASPRRGGASKWDWVHVDPRSRCGSPRSALTIDVDVDSVARSSAQSARTRSPHASSEQAPSTASARRTLGSKRPALRGCHVDEEVEHGGIQVHALTHASSVRKHQLHRGEQLHLIEWQQRTAWRCQRETPALRVPTGGTNRECVGDGDITASVHEEYAELLHGVTDQASHLGLHLARHVDVAYVVQEGAVLGAATCCEGSSPRSACGRWIVSSGITTATGIAITESSTAAITLVTRSPSAAFPAACRIMDSGGGDRWSTARGRRRGRGADAATRQDEICIGALLVAIAVCTT